MQRVDLACFPTPYFLVDEARLRRNLSRLKEVSDRTGCRILLAQKGVFDVFGLPNHAGISGRQYRKRSV